MRDFDGRNRFYRVTDHLYVQCCFVYTGEAAKKALSLDWPATHIHTREPRQSPEGIMLDATTKLYLVADERCPSVKYPSVTFDFHLLAAQADALGIRESYVEWNFLREEGKAQIACMRESEGVAFGFGRPHPFKPHFKPNPLFAGPLVDYRPGMKEGWKFEPVWMKIRPHEDAVSIQYYLHINPLWESGHVTLQAMMTIISQLAPANLAAYEFPSKRKPKVEHRGLRPGFRPSEFDQQIYRGIQHGSGR